MHSNAKDPRWCKCVSKVGNLGAATNAGNYIWEAGKERDRTWFLSIFAQDAVNRLVKGHDFYVFTHFFFVRLVFWNILHSLQMDFSFFGHHFTDSLNELKLIFAGIQKDFFSLILVTKRVVMWFYILSWILPNVFYLSVVVKWIAVWFASGSEANSFHQNQ